MRKKDYLTLASALKKSMETARDFANVVHVETLARYLADNLAVDKLEFLKACGIKP